MSNCTDCLLDLTDACPRGSGRAIDDEICDSFFPRETYQVNKNESWQLGYQQGRADREKEVLNYLVDNGYIRYGFDSEYLAEQLKKEQNNDNTN